MVGARPTPAESWLPVRQRPVTTSRVNGLNEPGSS
jgi:hypothetical protein